jgi:hypothetical protein
MGRQIRATGLLAVLTCCALATTAGAQTTRVTPLLGASAGVSPCSGSATSEYYPTGNHLAGAVSYYQVGIRTSLFCAVPTVISGAEDLINPITNRSEAHGECVGVLDCTTFAETPGPWLFGATFRQSWGFTITLTDGSVWSGPTNFCPIVAGATASCSSIQWTIVPVGSTSRYG